VAESFNFQKLMLTKHAQDTCTRNWYKLSGTRNLHVCRSIWYKFFSGTSFLHAIEHSSVQVQKLSFTWHELCNEIGWRVVLVPETVMNLRQIFRASFWYKFLERVLPSLVLFRTQKYKKTCFAFWLFLIVQLWLNWARKLD